MTWFRAPWSFLFCPDEFDANCPKPGSKTLWEWEWSTALLGQVEPVIWHFLWPLQYQLILTGHSLGAGTACCLAKILYDRTLGRIGPRAIARKSVALNSNEILIVTSSKAFVSSSEPCYY